MKKLTAILLLAIGFLATGVVASADSPIPICYPCPGEETKN